MKLLSAVIITSLSTLNAFAQAPFVNLGFEDADVSGYQYLDGAGYATVDAGLALPGWTGFVGTGQDTVAIYNSFVLDHLTVGIYSSSPLTNTPGPARDTPPSLAGVYSAYLQADSSLWRFGYPTDVSLAQTGLVPDWAQSLHFMTTSENIGFPSMATSEMWEFVLLINGLEVSFIELQAGVDGTLFGADVSAYADTMAEIRFLLRTPYGADNPEPFTFGIAIGLDEISFSSEPVPEPASGWLLLVGAAGFLAMRRKHAFPA